MNQKRIVYFDALNVFACIAVVGMHVNGTAVNTFAKSGNWLFSMLVESICYFAVPIFFMITGATLMNYRKRYDTKAFAKKRLERTMIPFIVWSLIAVIWCTIILKIFNVSDIINPLKLIDIVFNVRAFNIYYFFLNLFAVYLCIPVLSLIPEDKRIGSKGGFTYLIIYGFVTISLLPVLTPYLGIGWNNSIQNPMTGGYLLYVLLGYSLANTDIEKKSRILIYGFGVLGWAIHYFMTVVLSYQEGGMNFTFRGYTNFPTVFYAIAIFVAFKYIDWNKKARLCNYLSILSGASFGVYLLHKYPLYVICGLFPIDELSVLWRILGTIIIYCLSVCAVMILKRVPVVKKAVP